MKKRATAASYVSEYITDAKGRRVSVVIPIEIYEDLMEDLQDLAIIAERKNDEFIPYAEFRKQLKKNGRL